MASDDEGLTDEPPRRRRRQDEAGPAGDELRQASDDEETGGGYDVAPLPPEEVVDEKAKEVIDRKRRKRSRSIHKADEVPHPFTIRQGWLDGLFASTYLPLTLAVSIFLFPVMLPVAVVAAIIAHDAEPRKNALLTIGMCFIFPLLFCCICGLAGGFK